MLMNNTTLSLLIFIFCHLFKLQAQEMDIVRSNKNFEDKMLDFSSHISNPAKWNIKQIGVLSLSMDSGSTVFSVNGKSDYRLTPPEYINQVIVNSDSSVVVFSIHKFSNMKSEYVSLLRVSSLNSVTKHERLLTSNTVLFQGRKWLLVELGAVSLDGSKILAKFGIYSNSDFKYEWHTMDINTGKVVATGQTMDNAK